MTRPGWLVATGLLLASCSADPIVGAWSADAKVLEFHEDGTLEGIQRNDPACAAETAAIAACARRQRWERAGSTYRIELMGLTPRPTVGLGGMFAAPAAPDGSKCACVADVTATAELQGDELVIEGRKERARRVR